MPRSTREQRAITMPDCTSTALTKKYSKFRNFSAIVFDVARFLVYFCFLVGRIGLNSFSMSGGSCNASCLQSHIQKRDPKGASLEMTIPVPIGFLAKTFNH